MHSPPLKDMPETDADVDPALLAEHCRPDTHVRGEDTVRLKDFELFTENPTIERLAPDQMIGRTFLMPEAEDKSRERAKIVERIQKHKSQYDDHEDVSLPFFRVRMQSDTEDECEKKKTHPSFI